MRSTYGVIHLDRAARNLQALRASLKEGVGMMAIVKADAYGHGSVPFAKTALKNGATCLGVAIPEEGKHLREEGVTAPIVIIGAILPEDVPMVVDYDLQPAVFSAGILHALNEYAAPAGRTAAVHLAIDTGMGRIGVRGERELDQLLEEFSRCPAVKLHGMFTHFANSDGADKGFAHEQFARFMTMVDRVHRRGFHPILHAANSGAIADLPETQLDLVRAGIMMYGYYPSQNVHRTIPLEPVMEVRSRVTMVKTIPAGETVSYDRTYTTWRPTVVATVPIGYGDGYRRSLSGKGAMLIRGKRAPILGRVCMDQCMVDVTDIPGVEEDDEVVILGAQGKEKIDADEIAEWAGTISYEVLLSFSSRVPRVYVNE